MSTTFERLLKSKDIYSLGEHFRGCQMGNVWVADTASYEELGAIAAWSEDDTTKTDDALGAPGVFLRVIHGDEFYGRQEINDFWINLGCDPNSPDLYDHRFWDGFMQTAAALFAKFEESTNE